MSENQGLIFAYLLDGEGGGKSLDWQEVNSWSPSMGTLWIHLDYEHHESRHWIKDNSQLDSLTQQSLLAEETRPRCVSHDQGLLINLRGVNSNPGSEPEDMVSIRLYCDGKRIISTRKRRLLSVQDIGAAIEKGTGPKNAGGLIASLAYRLTARMSDVISALDDTVDAFEEEIIGQPSQSFRSQLVGLRREVIMLRRYLAPQRDALSRLQSENVDWLSAENKLTLREAGDRLIRYIEDLDSSRDRAAVAYEELNSQLSEQMNSRMYVLSVVAALFLPLGFLTGLFGINVGGIPFAEDPYGFIEIILLLVFIVVIQLVLFRYKKWF
ncbi:MAG: zinc transporter ZntB [Gammaproteobacteria bacterium]|jgi:zinc transporter